MLLAEVGLINAVNLGELDALVLQFGGRFLVVGSEGLAVTTPAGRAEFLAVFLHYKYVKGGYHGAKNSTRTRGSLETVSKLAGVTSITLEASSATARVTRARVVRERRRE